jgi:uncharacterized protein YjdB
MTLAACREKIVEPVQITELVAKVPAAYTMYPGETYQVVVTVTPNSGTSTTWTSSSDTTLSITNTGMVTAKNPGFALACASVTGYGQTQRVCTQITVLKKPVVIDIAIAVAPTTFGLLVGDSSQVAVAVAVPSGQSSAVTWTSKTVAVATVSASGYVRGVSAGMAIVEATSVADPTKKAQLTVTVTARPVTPPQPITISVSPTSSTLFAGDSVVAVATLGNVPVGASTALIWTSNSITTATVDATGKIRAIAPGNATITVRSVADTSKRATVLMTVNRRPATNPIVTGIAVVPSISTIDLAFGQDTALNVVVTGDATANKGYTCFSSNIAFLQVLNATTCQFRIVVGYPVGLAANAIPRIVYETLGVGSDGLKKRVEVIVTQKR